MRLAAMRTWMRRSAGAKRATPEVRARRRAGTCPAPRGREALSWRRVAIVSSAVLLAGGIGAVFVLAPGWGRGAEQFRVARVDVRGTTVLTDGEVRDLSGLTEGENLLAVSVSDVEAAVMSSPRVERAQASKLLPDRVLIRLVEKEPLALVETADGPVEVASDLTVLPRAKRTPFVDVPVVTGGHLDAEDSGVIEDQDVLAALDIIARAREVSRSLWSDISEVRIAPGSGLVIYTVADGAEIRVGSGALDDSGLKRLSLVLGDLEARGIRAETIDMRFQDQAVVRVKPGHGGRRA